MGGGKDKGRSGWEEKRTGGWRGEWGDRGPERPVASRRGRKTAACWTADQVASRLRNPLKRTPPRAVEGVKTGTEGAG